MLGQGDVRPGQRDQARAARWSTGHGRGKADERDGAPGSGLRTDAVGSRREGRAGPAPGSGLRFGALCEEGRA